jgi:hypothetical protein
MAYGDDSERIRLRAWEKYIRPQIQKGLRTVEVQIKPLMKELEAEGFPANHPRQFCKALQKKAFLQEKGLVMQHIDGPPSGTSTTVVLHYSVVGGSGGDYAPARRNGDSPAGESPEQRALRVTEALCGLLKDEIAAFGGTEAFMRWVRSDKDEDAA